MNTDWSLIRGMMNAAIDSCERIEAAGYSEEDRSATIDVQGQQVSVYEFIVSAWTFPESIRYQVIRERHEKGADLLYVPETARVLVSMAQACAELIGAQDAAPAEAEIAKMIRWYRTHAVPGIEHAIMDRRASEQVPTR